MTRHANGKQMWQTLPGSGGRLLTREGHIPGGLVCLNPPSISQPHRETKRAAGKRACLRHTTLWYRACTLLMGMRKRQFTLAVLLPLPGLVLCGGGIMAMESCAEDWTELSKSCFTPFGTESPLGGLPTKGFGEDLIWKPFWSLSETPFGVLTACWVCELG